MWAIFKREVKSFFLTPIGYVYMGIFLFLSGLFFAFLLLNPNQSANYTEVLGTMSFTLLFATPILTMRLISEEKKSGTDQLLLTSPVSLSGIVVGKYLAALFVFISTLVVTLAFPLILSRFATLDLSVIFLGYIGYFLLGAAFIAIGLFISSITENQTVAAIISFCALLFLWVLEFLKMVIDLPEKGQRIFDWFLVLNRYGDFESGLLNVGSVIFFMSLALVFLFLTLRSVEKRRWSRG